MGGAHPGQDGGGGPKVKGFGRLQALGRRASRRWQAFVGDGAAGVALAAAELDVLMPFHLRLNDRGRIVHVGPSLAKLLGGEARGELLDRHLVLVRPRSFGADGLAKASPASGSPWGEERRRRLVGRPLLFRLQRPQEQEVTLLGQLIRPAGQPDLLVLNPLFETLERLEAAGLHLHDYPIHDSTRMLLTAHLLVAGYRSALEELSLARSGFRIGDGD